LRDVHVAAARLESELTPWWEVIEVNNPDEEELHYRSRVDRALRTVRSCDKASKLLSLLVSPKVIEEVLAQFTPSAIQKVLPLLSSSSAANSFTTDDLESIGNRISQLDGLECMVQFTHMANLVHYAAKFRRYDFGLHIPY
jgi:hypothetical protein